MAIFETVEKKETGFTLLELSIIFAGAMIILGISVPAAATVMNQYRLVLASQGITSQLQFARMKAVASNEPFHVNFPAGQRFYQVETSTGAVVTGPFFLPPGVDLNNIDPGVPVTFGGNIVSFLPMGNVPAGGNGSAGRVKIINQLGGRIDIVVGTGGIIRQTPVYKVPPAPF